MKRLNTISLILLLALSVSAYAGTNNDKYEITFYDEIGDNMQHVISLADDYEGSKSCTPSLGTMSASLPFHSTWAPTTFTDSEDGHKFSVDELLVGVTIKDRQYVVNLQRADLSASVPNLCHVLSKNKSGGIKIECHNG